jgi:hypothetical protein
MLQPLEEWVTSKVTVTGTYYTIDGRTYPRVSTILGVKPAPYLDAWRKKVGQAEADRIQEETAEWGNKVHLITALNDTRQYKKMDKMLYQNEDLLIPLLTWQEWEREFVKQWLAVELLVWSDKIGCAGKIDRIGILLGDTRPFLGDLKTKTTVGDETGVQTAGYKKMYNERAQGRNKVVRTLAVHLPRVNTGYLRVKEFTKQGDRFEKEFMDLRKWHKDLHT